MTTQPAAIALLLVVPNGRELRPGGDARIRGRSSQRVRALVSAGCSVSSNSIAGGASIEQRRNAGFVAKQQS
jgi:hypothetical protein